jgi:hypothetical protein
MREVLINHVMLFLKETYEFFEVSSFSTSSPHGILHINPKRCQKCKQTGMRFCRVLKAICTPSCRWPLLSSVSDDRLVGSGPGAMARCSGRSRVIGLRLLLTGFAQDYPAKVRPREKLDSATFGYLRLGRDTGRVLSYSSTNAKIAQGLEVSTRTAKSF